VPGTACVALLHKCPPRAGHSKPCGGFTMLCADLARVHKMGDTVQAGPPAGWGPLLSPALLELSVAGPLSCSVSGLARFSPPQARRRPGLRLADCGHASVTRAGHLRRATQHRLPAEPTHSASPLPPQEAGVSERCPPAPDNRKMCMPSVQPRDDSAQRCAAATARCAAWQLTPTGQDCTLHRICF
jgi:hypothetical protein